MLRIEDGKLIFHYDAEEVWVEAWGYNALRIRAAKACRMPEEDWALCKRGEADSRIELTETGAKIENGKIYAEITERGKITVYRAGGRLLLEEYCRNRRDLFARWFEWGTFCPVMRLHGDREPRQPQVGTTGGAACCSGAANEVWSYGEEVYEICKKYLELREKMRPYTRGVMREAHEKGTPVMRTLFYMFPQDSMCWEVEDEYFFGPDILVAPVLYAGQKTRSIYLPKDEVWIEYFTGKEYDGGQKIEADTPLNTIPIFIRKSGGLRL